MIYEIIKMPWLQEFHDGFHNVLRVNNDFILIHNGMIERIEWNEFEYVVLERESEMHIMESFDGAVKGVRGAAMSSSMNASG